MLEIRPSGSINLPSLATRPIDDDVADAVNANLAAQAAMLFDLFAKVTATEIIGLEGTPVSNTSLSTNTTYALNQEVQETGFLIAIDGYGNAAGAFIIKRFTKSEDASGTATFTQIGSDYTVTIPEGLYSLTLADIGLIPVNAGEYLGFFSGSPSRVGRSSSESDGVWSSDLGAGNLSSFTDSDVAEEVAIQLRFTVGSVQITERRISDLEALTAALYEVALLQIEYTPGTFAPRIAFLSYGGAHYDFSDRGSQWQGSNQTSPVTTHNQSIGYVEDKSGNDRHFAATSTARKPVYKVNAKNGRSAAHFDGTNGLDAIELSLTRNLDKVHIFAVVNFSSASGTQPIITHQISPNPGEARLFFGQAGSGGDARPQALARQTDIGDLVSARAVANAETAYVIYEAVVDYAGGVVRFLTDGWNAPEGEAAFPTTANSDDTAESAAAIGAEAGETGLIGYIGEIIELTGDVDEATRIGIYSYLGHKWDIAYKDPVYYDPTGPLPALWTWFNEPRILALSTSHYLVGGVTSSGSVMVADYNFLPDTISHAFLFTRYNIDDHVNPSFALLSDDNVIAAFSSHGGVGGIGEDTLYVTKTVTPGDFSVWSTPLDITEMIKHNANWLRYSYANLVRLPDEADRLYLFYRSEDLVDYPPDVFETWFYSTSDDDGDTWAAGKQLFGAGRPYTKVRRNGDDRIDIICNTGHPASVPTNSTFHCYYQGGSFYETDGTLIGAIAALPFDQATELTTVYDGTTNRSWIWDIVIDGSGDPVITFATFHSISGSSWPDHRYRQARWTGSGGWVSYEICTAGGQMGDQPTYSGGVCTDPDDINIVYCSRQVNDAGTIDLNGVHQIFKFVSADDGVTWGAGTQLTFNDLGCYRPYKPEGGGDKVFYFTGRYTGYTDYDAHVEVIDTVSS